MHQNRSYSKKEDISLKKRLEIAFYLKNFEGIFRKLGANLIFESNFMDQIVKEINEIIKNLQPQNSISLPTLYEHLLCFSNNLYDFLIENCEIYGIRFEDYSEAAMSLDKFISDIETLTRPPLNIKHRHYEIEIIKQTEQFLEVTRSLLKETRSKSNPKSLSLAISAIREIKNLRDNVILSALNISGICKSLTKICEDTSKFVDQIPHSPHRNKGWMLVELISKRVQELEEYEIRLSRKTRDKPPLPEPNLKRHKP